MCVRITKFKLSENGKGGESDALRIFSVGPVPRCHFKSATQDSWNLTSQDRSGHEWCRVDIQP